MARLPDPALERLDEQFGCIGRSQLRAWLTEDAIDAMVQRGQLVPTERGSYRVRGSPVIPEQSAIAAVHRARPGARVTGPFVLALLNVDGFTRDDPFEVLTAPGRRLRNVGFAHRRNPTPDEPGAWFRALPITTPTVSLVDSARFGSELGERRLRVGLDVMTWRGMTSPQRVLDRARLLGPRDRGAAFFLGLLGDDLARSESDGERDLGRLLAVFEPPPEPQVWVTPRRRVDWYFRPLRLALEYLGQVDHATAEARMQDAARSDELAGVGVRVVPVVSRDLRDPQRLLAWVEALLARRAYELGVDPPVRRHRGQP